MEVVGRIVQVFANSGFPTKVLAALTRHPKHVLDAALLGAHVSTIPFGVIAQLASHPLTDQGLEVFLKDWKKVSG